MGRLTLLDGVKIAYQEWGHHTSASKVLALHGWLDNSNSFHYLGQYLGERGHHVVAIDFAG
jgi:alpha-beta hydrolase superfamily lysophospholipase